MTMLSPDDPRAPKFWRHEITGRLANAVEAYLQGKPLDASQVNTMRAYLWQWIMSPVWRGPEIDKLRETVGTIQTREDIKRWLWDALAEGIDPL